MSKKPNSVFISLPHAAALKGMDVRTFARHLYRTNVRTFKIGKNLFLLRADLTRWKTGGETS